MNFSDLTIGVSTVRNGNMLVNWGSEMVTADCLPVIVYDQENQILALVHLG